MANQVFQVNLTATSLDGVMTDPETKLLQAHIANGDVHVLASDKAVWNAKADAGTVDILGGAVVTVRADIATLIERIVMLEDQLVGLKQTDVLVVDDIANATDASKDLVISLYAPVTAVNNITGKSVDIKAATVESGRLNIAATEDVVIKNLTTSGNLAKSVSNAAVSINNTGYVRVADCVIDQTGYNVIEIGLTANKAPKSVLIDNVAFNAAETNNVISIFDTQDGAVINISNCKFVKCSNPIRLSNRSGKKVTLNITNCEFGEWETGEYSGMIICQDYTSSTAAAAIENNLFGPDKVTINIVNCTKQGAKIVIDDPATVCGTKQDTQLLYVYCDKGGFVLYDANRYPTINAQ